MKSVLFIAAIWLFLCILLGGVVMAAGPIVWVAPSLQRVMKEEKAGSTTSITLTAARGEYESFQIIVQAPPGGLTKVRVTGSDLTGQNNETIALKNLTLYREHYLEVKTATPFADRGANPSLGPGWYADALIPFVDPATGKPPKKAKYTAAPFNLQAGQNQPIWVDVFIPRCTQAGQYIGTFTVASDQGTAEVILQVKVWDFDLPRTPALKSWFGLRSDRQLGGPELLRHRMMPDQAPPGVERTWIDQYGLNCIDLGMGSGAYISRPEMGPPPSIEEFRQAAAKHERDLLLYDYIADEIGGSDELHERIREWGRNLHAAGIKNLITMTPIPELMDDGSGTGRSAVDIWVLLPVMYESDPKMVAQALAKGDEIWSYTALAQDTYSPKWEVDFAPINYRIMGGFINQSLGLTGLLYWRVDLWSKDPYTEMSSYAHEDGPFPGEGMLVYPGEPVGVSGVVASMRLKYLRDSADDYDYIEILKRLGKGPEALTIVRSVGPDWRHWNHDPAALEAARIKLGDLIEATLGQR